MKAVMLCAALCGPLVANTQPAAANHSGDHTYSNFYIDTSTVREYGAQWYTGIYYRDLNHWSTSIIYHNGTQMQARNCSGTWYGGWKTIPGYTTSTNTLLATNMVDGTCWLIRSYLATGHGYANYYISGRVRS